MSTRTMIFGDDSSPGADLAWLCINSHRWQGWRLEVVTAHPSSAGLRVGAGAENDLSPQPTSRQAFAEAEFDEVANLSVDADPRLALSRTADLVVVGPRGPGLLKSLHLGGTTEWLLLHPPAPLLIVRHGQPIRRVVVCADGSAHAALVVSALADLPWAHQLDVTVLVVDDGRTDIDAASSSAVRMLEPAVGSVNVNVASGRPAVEIEDHLRRTSPDLVALGTMGLTGLRHLRVGSTAGAIARAASCSVLVACDENAYERTAQSAG